MLIRHQVRLRVLMAIMMAPYAAGYANATPDLSKLQVTDSD